MNHPVFENERADILKHEKRELFLQYDNVTQKKKRSFLAGAIVTKMKAYVRPCSKWNALDATN